MAIVAYLVDPIASYGWQWLLIEGAILIFGALVSLTLLVAAFVPGFR